MLEKKEPTDDTGTHVYSQLVNSQHVSGIIMPIVRRTDCIKPLSSCPGSTQPQPAHPG